MRFARALPQFFNALSGGVRGGGAPPAATMLGTAAVKGGEQAVLETKKSKILKSLKSARNGWKWVGEGVGVLESAICARYLDFSTL